MHDQQGVVYLVHFAWPWKHAGHYLGYSSLRRPGWKMRALGLLSRYEARLYHHRQGTGSRLMAVIQAAGIPWHVSRLWTGVTRDFERRLKNRHGASRFCPACKANAGAPAPQAA